MDLHVFIPLANKKCVFGMPFVCYPVYGWMCSLPGPERMGGFYSY
jgi:hypothetical protein